MILSRFAYFDHLITFPFPIEESKRWTIGDWLTKKLNPDATKADVGERMEAYFDEKLKRWVFPGDDLTELAKKLPPPPSSAHGIISPSIEKAKETNDPLSSLMAPPSLRISGGHSLKKGVVSSSSIANQSPVIPQFSIFQAKDNEINQKDKENIEI